jgi:hypothetical protein
MTKGGVRMSSSGRPKVTKNNGEIAKFSDGTTVSRNLLARDQTYGGIYTRGTRILSPSAFLWAFKLGSTDLEVRERLGHPNVANQRDADSKEGGQADANEDGYYRKW